jgi:hypothetical protein
MKTMKHFFMFAITFLFLFGISNSVQAQNRPVRAVAKTTTVKPLDAKTLKLDSKAARNLSRWKKAKHMELLENGNFTPMKNPQASTTGGSLPGGMPTSFADGTNCAKIECPDVFGPDVTCWECH